MIRYRTSKPALIVDAMKAMAAASKGRTSFAIGCCVRGTYIPSARVSEVTRSPSFTRPSRVLARFSTDSVHAVGQDDNLALRGFSLRLGEGDHRSDILTQSAPVHYARTPDQMLAFPQLCTAGGGDRPEPSKIEAFFAANPETRRQANYIASHPLPTSFADTTYWAVHAFPATSSDREKQFIKFKVAPVASGGALAPGGVKITSADAIEEDLRTRIAAGGIRFSIMALLGHPHDPVLDVTIRWPDEDSRDAVRLGTIVITAIEADDTCDVTVFDPAAIAEGIGYPPDAIFAARRKAYAISLSRRR